MLDMVGMAHLWYLIGSGNGHSPLSEMALTGSSIIIA
jgi:hypothetical protein